jgi:small-conductance mechanosensitive channel
VCLSGFGLLMTFRYGETMTINDVNHSLNEIVSSLFSSATILFPRIFWAVILAGSGWIVAWILKKIAIKMVGGLDQLFQRRLAQDGRYQIKIKQFESLVGNIVFWLSLLFFLVLAIHILQLEFLSTFLQNVLENIPHLAIAIFIIFTSFFLGSISRQLVTTAFTAMQVEHAELLGKAVKMLIVSMGLLLGVAQIGIDVSFLTTVISISIAAALGALALAFGIGAQSYVANILSSTQIRKIYQNDDTVMIDNRSGKIIEITATMIILQSEAGQISIPAKLFLEKASLLINPEENDAA